MRSRGIWWTTSPCGSDIPVRVMAAMGAPSKLCLGGDFSCPAWISAISPGTGVDCGGAIEGAGMATGPAAAEAAGAAMTMRGPEGRSESSPLPSALRFSTGLCSSTALMCALLIIYLKEIVQCLSISNSNNTNCHPNTVFFANFAAALRDLCG